MLPSLKEAALQIASDLSVSDSKLKDLEMPKLLTGKWLTGGAHCVNGQIPESE